MDIYADGYFNVNLSDSIPAWIIEIIICFISLVVQLVIACTAMYKLKDEPSIALSLKLCFVSSFLCAFQYTFWNVWWLIYHLRCIYDDDLVLFPEDNVAIFIFIFVIAMSFGSFFWFILVTFIIRLHITFKTSAFRMSTPLTAVFVVILVLIAVGWCSVCVRVSGIDDFPLEHWNYAMFSLLGLYAIGCVLAVYFFVSNLSKLTTARVQTPTQIPESPSDIELDRLQRRLSNLSAKYTILFVISIASTTLLYVASYTVGLRLRTAFQVPDMTFNLWCLYLQFPFAKNHYRRCCGYCDKKGRDYGVKRTKLRIHNHSKEKEMTSNHSQREPLCTSSSESEKIEVTENLS